MQIRRWFSAVQSALLISSRAISDPTSSASASGATVQTTDASRPAGHPRVAALVVGALHGGPGDAEGALLITIVLLPRMVERLAEDILGVRRQVVRNRRGQFVIRCIRHGS